MLTHHAHGLLLRCCIIPKPWQPVNLLLTTEPGHLSLGVVTVYLLRGGNGLSSTEFTAQVLQGLFVSKRGERPCLIPIPVPQSLSFFNES